MSNDQAAAAAGAGGHAAPPHLAALLLPAHPLQHLPLAHLPTLPPLHSPASTGDMYGTGNYLDIN